MAPSPRLQDGQSAQSLFEKLPVELKLLTYDFYFQSVDLKPHIQISGEGNATKDCLSILLLNKQIHDEASTVLKNSRVEINISPDSITYGLTASTFSVNKFSHSDDIIPCDDESGANTNTSLTHETARNTVIGKQISLCIDWDYLAFLDTVDPLSSSEWSSSSGHPALNIERKKALISNITAVVNVLLTLSSMKQIDITWKAPQRDFSSGLARVFLEASEPDWPSAHKILVLLRPLKALRARRPSLTVQLPKGGEMESEELARTQKNRCRNNEKMEDAQEVLEDMMFLAKRMVQMKALAQFAEEQLEGLESLLNQERSDALLMH